MGRYDAPLKKLAFGIEPSNRSYRLRLSRYLYLGEALAAHLPAGRSRVLDAGCGKGRVGLYWSRLAPPGKEALLLGMDLSPLRLGMAAARGYGALLRADLVRPWPFPAGSFQAVVLEQVLEHFDDRHVDFLLSEAARVLEPGGLALIGSPIFLSPALWMEPLWRVFHRYLRKRNRKGTASPHLQRFRLDDLLRRGKAHGFVPLSVRGFRLFSLPRGLLEDYRWYYRLHRLLGARFPRLCVEATVLARSKEAPASMYEGARSLKGGASPPDKTEAALAAPRPSR